MLDAAAADAAGAAALVHDGGGDPARSARAAAAAAVRAADCAVQLHGGYGYVSDHPAERLLRDAISLRALAAGPRAGAAADDLLGGDEEEAR
jgi:alkylation response protein AidB-like acyl-CoA dehydrogenase